MEKSTFNEKPMSIESLAQYMQAWKGHRDDLLEENPNDKLDMILFRGMPSDSFKMVGRIDFDQANIKDTKPEKRWAIIDIEKEMFRMFQKRARAFIKIEPENDWEWMSLARHHMLPTRILDWSRDPLIALWFAVQDVKEFMHEDSVVCVFFPGDSIKIQDSTGIFKKKNQYYVSYDSPFDIDKKRQIVLYRPSSINERIDFQSSWFTVHPHSRGTYKELKSNNRRIRKIYISKEKKHAIRKELAEIGINSAAVFRDMDSLGLYIKHRFFKTADELFTDDSFAPDIISSRFRQIQGILGLYNSPDVKEIRYFNMKGAYNRLISILSDPKHEVQELVTFNNINREFLSYRNQREIFLRLIEKTVVQKKLKYRRLQFLNVYANYNRLQNETTDYTNTQQDIKHYADKKLYELSEVWLDGMAQKHLKIIHDKTPGSIRYLLLMDDQDNKGTTTPPGFLLIKAQNYDEGSKKKTLSYYLLLEFNHEYLVDLIEPSQSLTFFLEFKATTKKPFLVNKYSKKFDQLFNKKSKGIYSSIPYSKLADYNKKTKETLLSNFKEGEFLKINYKKMDQSSKVNRELDDCLLIPINECENRLSTVQDLLDYVYYKLKFNDPKHELQDFSYGENKDWCLYANNKPIEIIDEFKDDQDDSKEENRGYYKRYFYSQPLVVITSKFKELVFKRIQNTEEK